MDNRRKELPQTYAQAGFDGFMRRSIDGNGHMNLRQASSDFRKMNNQSINFDHQQTTGSLGSVIQVGGITIDGSTRRISVFDENGNEVVRIGKLDA